MGVHQLFFPLVGEADEDVLARALQALSVVRDKVHEALNVDVIFKIDGQDVSQIQILLALLRLANWKLGFSKIKRIETIETSPQYYRVSYPSTNHRRSGIALFSTYASIDKSTFFGSNESHRTDDSES